MERDAIRLVGTMLRFVRTVDLQFRRRAETELSLADLGVLARIANSVTQPSAIADQLRIDRPRVTRMVDRLVALGFVERATDLEDRRRSLLSLTDIGRLELEHCRGALTAVVDDLLTDLHADDRAALLSSVEALRPIVEGAQTTPPEPAAT